MDAVCEIKNAPHSPIEWAGDEDYAFSQIWFVESDMGEESGPRPPYHRGIIRKYRKLPHGLTGEKPSTKQRPSSRKESDEVAGIDDSEARKNLARIIGLSNIPKRKWGAHKNIDGIFDKVMKYEKETDPVMITRRIRRG